MTFPLKTLGRLLILALEEEKWSHGISALLTSLCPAGLILSARHCRSFEEPQCILREAQKALGTRQFLGLKGDQIQPDPFRDFASSSLPRLPAPIDVAPKGIGTVERFGRLRGGLLALLGFNVDFSLSLDLTPADTTSALASRTFSDHPVTVSACGSAYVAGLRQRGILPCAGHFPGIGSVAINSQEPQPICPKSMADLWQSDLLPFREMHARLPLIWISHASYKAYDFDLPRPASLSPGVVTGLLRDKLGYQGVAVADLEEIAQAWGGFDLSDAAVRALEAGCDALLVPAGKDWPEKILRSINHAVETGQLAAERVNQSLARIEGAEKKLAVPRTTGHQAVQQFAEDVKKWSEDFAG